MDTHTNPDCGIGMNIQFALQEYYDKVQRDAERSMQEISLQDIIQSFEERVQRDSADDTL